jgi:ABC-type lipoprotein release transport system permease subunit
VLLALAWRNLWRQARRTLLSLFSIAFAATLLVFMLSFQLGVYGQMKENVLRLFDGYAEFQAPGYADDPDLHKTIADPAKLSREAETIPGVAAAAPRVNTFAILSNGQKSIGAAVIGVDPARERKVSSLASAIVAGRYLLPSDGGSAVLGDALARNLGVSVGEKVTLLGSGYDGSVAADVLTVVGLYRSGIPDIDRTLMEMPLARAQATFSLGDRANTLALSGPTLAGVEASQATLKDLGTRHGAALRDWGALEPALRDSIQLKYVTTALIYATLVFVVAFIILNTLLMSVLERTREFGVLLAIGMRPSQIGGMVWLELLALALLGGVAGIVVGSAMTLWFVHHGIGMGANMDQVLRQFAMPTRLYPSMSPLSVLLGPAVIVLAICAGGLVPYLHVRRLVASAAMRAS